MLTVSNKKNRYIKQTLSVLFIFFCLRAGSVSTGDFSAFAKSMQFAFLSDTSSSGSFSVITYNIAGLPGIISSAMTERESSITEIGKRLNAFDIVHVQEDFSYNDDLYSIENMHPFRSVTKGNVPFGDGLNTLSKYPVTEITRISWQDCTGADCLTPKGFSYSRIEIARNHFIDFYNVHANAFNDTEAAAARRNNIRQLSDYIKTHSQGHAVVVMGDLNAHYSFYHDNLNTLLTDNSLTDTWVSLQNNGSMPIALTQTPEKNILGLNASTETIDKILYRSSNEILLKPSEYKLERQLFNTATGIPLSDHHPVSLSFAWTLQDQTKNHVASID
ncbi:endonuclease/exonuclease/phosphatase family protein [Dyadobacter sp. NIV53]|uniref:endonuclease/exonuclease/phosphatase family protein n=1 Tax=Dyadobacter sp. NIV53 TaxID=2861765 RepID=UPI001E2D4D14|nr:endonuclease/exonuclease/phosphatase family protein [Dyadobacter sp. NIV53]